MGQIAVAQAVAKLLEKMGTEVFFGVNGHGNWALLDALVHETGIRGVPARAEDHAVQMADGYWRMRRTAPLPIVTTSVGPGNMNIVPAIATAFYEFDRTFGFGWCRTHALVRPWRNGRGLSSRSGRLGGRT